VTLTELVDAIDKFSDWSFADKIRLFVWFAHAYRKLEVVTTAHVKRSFEELHLDPPASISSFVNSMVNKNLPDLLRVGDAFKLHKRVRDEFDKRYGMREASVVVHQLLADLPTKVPNLKEREFLEETLRCFKHRAFRASVVMAWNLAYDHLCHWVLAKHLAPFNAQIPVRYQKKTGIVIAKRDDFAELKESEVLEVCNSAGLTANAHKVLTEKLTKRNLAAHPSGIEVNQLTAEEYINDLVLNVVLKLV
jgi:hypothetical protein